MPGSPRSGAANAAIPFWADVAGKGSDYTDFMRFHFFQAMTPVGGFLLVAICGPGKLSLDKKD